MRVGDTWVVVLISGVVMICNNMGTFGWQSEVFFGDQGNDKR